MATTPQEADRAEIYVRNDLPAPVEGHRDGLLDRLDELVSSGSLTDVSVSTWRKRVPLADADTPERQQYERFEEWACDRRVSLRPFFDTRECYSWDSAERRYELVLPASCIALYDAEDDLLTVAPRSTPDGTVSVEDCVERLLTEDARGEEQVATAD